MRTDQTYGNLNITNIFQIYIIKCAYNYPKLEQIKKKKSKPSSYVMLRKKFFLLKKKPYNSDSQEKKITT